MLGLLALPPLSSFQGWGGLWQQVSPTEKQHPRDFWAKATQDVPLGGIRKALKGRFGFGGG